MKSDAFLFLHRILLTPISFIACHAMHCKKMHQAWDAYVCPSVGEEKLKRKFRIKILFLECVQVVGSSGCFVVTKTKTTTV
jgi:hypothetical protein